MFYYRLEHLALGRVSDSSTLPQLHSNRTSMIVQLSWARSTTERWLHTKRANTALQWGLFFEAQSLKLSQWTSTRWVGGRAGNLFNFCFLLVLHLKGRDWKKEKKKAGFGGSRHGGDRVVAEWGWHKEHLGKVCSTEKGLVHSRCPIIIISLPPSERISKTYRWFARS